MIYRDLLCCMQEIALMLVKLTFLPVPMVTAVVKRPRSGSRRR